MAGVRGEEREMYTTGGGGEQARYRTQEMGKKHMEPKKNGETCDENRANGRLSALLESLTEAPDKVPVLVF